MICLAVLEAVREYAAILVTQWAAAQTLTRGFRLERMYIAFALRHRRFVILPHAAARRMPCFV
jgi:hypothetical protein